MIEPPLDHTHFQNTSRNARIKVDARNLKKTLTQKDKFKALPPELLDKARELRKNETDAEHYLWQLLRNRNLCGWKFRRQHPMDGYILDFYCSDARLGIELDGGQHTETEQAQKDTVRTRRLEESGIKILRFWNNDLLKKPESVLQVILDALFRCEDEGGCEILS